MLTQALPTQQQLPHKPGFAVNETSVPDDIVADTTSPGHDLEKLSASANVNTQRQHIESSILYTKVQTAPPKVVRAEGNCLYTETGTKIFDATCGAAVACIGHNDTRVKDAINRQLDTVAYCYAPFFTTDAAEALATELSASTGGKMSKAFIVSSGKHADDESTWQKS